MESDSHANPTSADVTLAQIERLIADVADLATHDVSNHEFHAELLDRAVVGLAAIGGAVWDCQGGARVAIGVESIVDVGRVDAIQSSLPERQSHVEAAARSGRAGVIPPDGSASQNPAGTNPTGCLLIICPIRVAAQTKAVVEVMQRPDCPPESRDGFLEFLDELCHHAGEFHTRRELNLYRERAVLWARFEAFSHRVHSKIDLRETAYTIVNESRSVIGCERVSLAEVRGTRCRLLAVSGVDVINPRSNSVRALEALINATVATGEPFWYAGRSDELAPQIETPLEGYLEHSPARLLAIVPLYTGDDQADDHENNMTGAMVIERFDGEFDDEMQRRIGAACGHAALALGNAIDHRNRPTIPILGPAIAARRRSRTGWTRRWLIAAAISLTLIAALIVIPADFKVQSRGELQPAERHHVFAPVDGTVRINQLPVSRRGSVTKNEVVAVIDSGPLDLKLNQIWGELQTVEKQLDAVRNERFGRERTDGEPPRSKTLISARKQELEQQRASLRARLKLLEAQKADLTVRSPVAGDVLTWDVVRRLEGRPIRQGQILMSVAKLDGPWEILLRVPERDIGHVLDAQRQTDTKLSVTFQTANQPGVVYDAHVKKIATATQLDADGRSIVYVTLIDDISVPALEAGLLSDVRVTVGTKVKAGDVLGRLDQTKAKLTVSQAEIDVAIEELNAKNDVKVRFARKSKQVADSELARNVASNNEFKGSVSESQLDILRLTAERAALSVEEADRELSIAGMTLKLKRNKLLNAKDGVRRREIRTTVPGIVVDVKRQAGEWVEPGQTVFRVIRLDRLRVKGFVKAAELPGELMGRSVSVNVNLYGRRNVSFPGKAGNAYEKSSEPLMSLSTNNSNRARPMPIRRRKELAATPQWHRGHRHWVVKDPVSLRYFHLRDEEHAIWQALDGKSTVDDVCRQFERRFTPQRMSAAQLRGFLSRLHRDGLIVTDAAGQGDELIKRLHKSRKEAIKNAATNILAIRFPGIDPERFLRWTDGLGKRLFHPVTAAAVLATALAALTLIVVQFDQFRTQLPTLDALLTINRFGWLLVTLAGVKILHELSHAMACRRFGGECHEIGLMLLVFTPCLYCNVTDSWRFPSKWRRIAVAAAGMYIEIALASICTFLWWFSQPGLFHSLCMNIVIVCSVSTIIVNGNPLLRYDGYFILADLIEIPNLRQKSRVALGQFLSRICLGIEAPVDTREPIGQRRTLIIYASVSLLYRAIVLAVILWVVYRFLLLHQLEIVARLFVLLTLASVLAIPISRALRLFRDPLRRNDVRLSRLTITAIVFTLLLVCVAFVPLPASVNGVATIESEAVVTIYVTQPGRLSFAVAPGTPVKPGDVIARLENPEITDEILELKGEQQRQRRHLENLQLLRLQDARYAAEIPAVRERIADLSRRIVQRSKDAEELVLRSPIEGIVLSPLHKKPADTDPTRLDEWSGSPLDRTNVGSYLTSETALCQIGRPERFQVTSLIAESEVEFVKPGQTVSVIPEHHAGHVLKGRVVELAKLNLDDLPPRFAVDSLPLTKWERQIEFTTGNYATTDYDFESPSTDLMTKEKTVIKTKGFSDYEIYEYPGGYTKTADGKPIAVARMEAFESSYETVTGTGNCLSFSPGNKFKLKSHPVKDEAGLKYVLTEVNHKAFEPTLLSIGTNEGVDDADTPLYINQFKCIPAKTTFRPLLQTPTPRIQGLQTAVVVGAKNKEIFTDKYGRIKIQFHWDREGKFDDKSSFWVRVAQSWAGSKRGTLFTPRVGDEVVVDFLDGDPDRPLVVGSLYNKDNVTPYKLPDEAAHSGIKTFSTDKGKAKNFNELLFVDTIGKEQIYFHAERDFERVVENDDKLKIGFETKDPGNQTIDIFNDRTVTIDKGIDTLSIKTGDRKVNVDKGDHLVTIKQGNYKLDVTAGKSEMIAAQKLLLKFPTLLNGEEVTEAHVPDGSLISAGTTEFTVTLEGFVYADDTADTNQDDEAEDEPIESGYRYVATPLARDVAAKCEIEPEALQQLQDTMTTREYVEHLIENDHVDAAIGFLAAALPKREAVWWGYQACGGADSDSLPEDLRTPLDAARQWVVDPSEENRRAAETAANSGGLTTPASCVAMAAFLSGGSLAPADLDPVPPPDHLTAHTIGCAINIAAVSGDPAKIDEKKKQLLELGIEVADGQNRWSD
eukprot:g26695.t1